MIDAPAAWAEVLATHRAELVRTAQMRLPRWSDAEDVVHEVALRVLRVGRAPVDVAAPAAYLRRAVLNECVSRWRRGGRDVLVATVPDQPVSGTVEACLDRMVLNRALAGLTERQRRVITLSLLDDRADAEIAATLGITDVTVRTTRLRALARLRLLLADSLPDRGGAGRRRTPAGYAEPAASTRDAAGCAATKPASWSTAA
jgi:RNA polymerase sigma factor (sigma-70 family)